MSTVYTVLPLLLTVSVHSKAKLARHLWNLCGCIYLVLQFSSQGPAGPCGCEATSLCGLLQGWYSHYVRAALWSLMPAGECN